MGTHLVSAGAVGLPHPLRGRGVSLRVAFTLVVCLLVALVLTSWEPVLAGVDEQGGGARLPLSLSGRQDLGLGAVPGREAVSGDRASLFSVAGPLVQVTTDPSWDYAPAIVQAADGTLWAVWTSWRSGNEDLWYKTSADGGATW